MALNFSDRLSEFNLKEMKLVLHDLREVKAEVESLYSKIDDYKQGKMILDDARIEALGFHRGALATSGALCGYVSGCIKRERERLAKIFAEAKAPTIIATAILDSSFDDRVFKFEGPHVALEAAPRSRDEQYSERWGKPRPGSELAK